MKKTLTGVLAIIALLTAGLFFVTNANATGTTPVDCSQPTITIVVTEAYDETVPGTPDLWWNWSPNHQQGPFEGPPAFPTDERGTWQGPHENGGPSQDTYGTFQQGNGNGSWFHRDHGTDDTVIHHDAVTEEIPNPDYPCVTDSPTDTPTTDVPTDTPTTDAPTDTPTPDEPTTPVTPENPNTPPTDEVRETMTSQQYTCNFHATYYYEKQDGAWVEINRTKELYAESQCDPGKTEPNFKEEGF